MKTSFRVGKSKINIDSYKRTEVLKMKLSKLEKVLKKKCFFYNRKVSNSFANNSSTIDQIPGSIPGDHFAPSAGIPPVFRIKKNYPFDMMGTIISKSFPLFQKFGADNPNGNEKSEQDYKEEEEKPVSYFDCKEDENLTMDFFKHTSLHGLKYIGERKQHIVERVFWILAFVIGLTVACYMISDVWKKYRNNSVIITFAPYDTKIEEIPFPAITICNMNKVLKSKANQFMKKAVGASNKKETKDAQENLYYLNHVCSSSKSFTKSFNYSAFRGKINSISLNATNQNEDNYDGGKEDLWQFFLKASPSCHEMILKCIWQDEIKNCSELFIPIETDYGKCCSYNSIPSFALHRINTTNSFGESTGEEQKVEPWEWDGDSLFKKDDKKVYPTFPRRQKIPGKSFGLSILLNPDLDEYFCTTSDSVGFRIVSHLPIDVPHISDLGSAIKPNSEVFINIRPEVTIADKDNIVDFSLDQRQCYFNEEHPLGFYNYYSSNNCIDECIANLTKNVCKCRRHYQPGDDSIPLCGPKQFQCASNIKKKFVTIYKEECKICIPTCTEIVYHTETTYTKLQNPEILWIDSHNKMADWGRKNVSIVHIYFGEGSTNAKLRKELYGTVDLIANLGGLMGLCLGFSGLSLIEVIYFLTLRALCRTRRNRKKFQNQITDKKVQLMQTKKPGIGKSGMTRSETTTKLLSYDNISYIPPYDPPHPSKQNFHTSNNSYLL